MVHMFTRNLLPITLATVGFSWGWNDEYMLQVLTGTKG